MTFREIVSVQLCAVGLFLSACGQEGFEVGDCVTVSNGLRNDNMQKVECRKTTLDEKLDGDSVYRISSIIDYEARCSPPSAITFDHEPLDATFCLTEY